MPSLIYKYQETTYTIFSTPSNPPIIPTPPIINNDYNVQPLLLFQPFLLFGIREYLKQYKITFNHGKIVNVCVFCALSSNLNNVDRSLENFLFRAVKLNKMLLLVSTNILDMVLDLIQVEHFYFLVANSLKM